MSSAEFQGTAAVRQIRMLLIRAGLREDDADTFLEHLRREFTHGNLNTEQERLLFCQRYIEELAAERLKPRKLVRRIEAIILGAAGSALWSLLNGGFDRVYEHTKDISQGQYLSRSAKRYIRRRWDEQVLFPMDRISVRWAFDHSLCVEDSDNALEELFRRVLQLVEEVNGECHPYTAAKLDDLGTYLDAQGRHLEAELLLRRAVQIEEVVLGSEHRYTGAALSNLGVNLARQSVHAEAEIVLRRGLDIEVNALGDDDLDVGAAYSNLGFDLYLQGRWTEAKPLLECALLVAEKTLNPSDPRVTGTKTVIDEVLAAQGKKVGHGSLSLGQHVMGDGPPRTPGHRHRQSANH